jgi:hypothetical protein
VGKSAYGFYFTGKPKAQQWLMYSHGCPVTPDLVALSWMVPILYPSPSPILILCVFFVFASLYLFGYLWLFVSDFCLWYDCLG